MWFRTSACFFKFHLNANLFLVEALQHSDCFSKPSLRKKKSTFHEISESKEKVSWAEMCWVAGRVTELRRGALRSQRAGQAASLLFCSRINSSLLTAAYPRRQQVPPQSLFQLEAWTDLEKIWRQLVGCYGALRARSGTHAPLRTSILSLQRWLIYSKTGKREGHMISLSLPWRGGSTMRVTNCSYYRGSTFQVPVTLADFKRWVLLLPLVSFCLSKWHDAPQIHAWKISPEKKERERERNLPATTDCVTSSTPRVTPPTRTPPPPPQDGQRRFTHTQMVASERRVGTERKFAPIRVQRLLSAVLKAHAPTDYKADF